jgi:hypothetical protein
MTAKPMTRIFLKLGVALVTFTLGVSVTAIYCLYYLPDARLPDITKVDARYSCFPGLSLRVEKSESQTEYFHVADLAEDLWPGRYDLYSAHLKVMNELPLAALVDEDESYRFLWLRTFHRPVMVRVWRTGNRYFTVVKRLSGRGGYAPGTSDLYWARSLSESEWDAFMMHLEHSEYWLMPKEYPMAQDGAEWILEGYREGRYHVVDRQSPDDGAYRDACLFLLRQSGLLAEIPTDEVY